MIDQTREQPSLAKTMLESCKSFERMEERKRNELQELRKAERKIPEMCERSYSKGLCVGMIVAGLMGIGGMFYIGQNKPDYSQPIESRDVDNDGDSDLVLKLRSGEELVLYKDSTGYSFDKEGEARK